MGIALGALRVPPAQFWAMTLPELDALLRGALGPRAEARALSRTGLADLMSRFPDDVARPQ